MLTQVRDPAKGKVYIVAEARLSALPGAVPKASKKGKEGGGDKGGDKPPQGGFEVLSKCSGKDLVGLRYAPLFPYFSHMASVGFKVVSDGYVTDDSGTGIVHQVWIYVCEYPGSRLRAIVGSVSIERDAMASCKVFGVL